MVRARENFATIVNLYCALADKRVLEIGCGSGNYTKQLAPLCVEIVAIDPDAAAVQQAQDHVRSPNVAFKVMPVEELARLAGTFEVVIFTLSLHHVPDPLMNEAINEAVRAADSSGFIVFLEPDHEGSFFEAELAFDACDGDEREAKAHAYRAMLSHPRLVGVAELPDQTEFRWDSLAGFVDTMRPRKNLSQLEPFLQEHHFTLSAKRRINIFKISSR